MAKPISIPIVSDSKDVAKELKRNVEEPLEQLQEKFSDVARAGEDSGDSIVRVYTDAERQTDAVVKKAKTLEEALDETRKTARKVGDAEKDVRGLGDEMDKTAKSADKLGDAGKDIGDGVKRGVDRAEEGLNEFRDEADSVAREAATSFDGSAESISDVFRDLAANAFIGFGPAAAIAGIGISAGIGIGVAELEKMAEKANEAKEAQGELVLELLEVDGQLEALDIAGKVNEWAVAIQDNKEWWEVWQQSATTNLDDVQSEAKRTGVEVGDMLMAMSGYDSDVALDVLSELESKTAALRKEAEKYADAPIGSGNGYLSLEKEILANEELASKIRETTGLTEEAVEVREVLAQATADAAAETERLAAKNGLLEELGSSLGDLVGSWTEYEDAETGALDPSAYLAGMQARAEATTSYADNIALIADQVSPETLNAIYEEGLDFAPMLQSIIDAGLVEQMDSTFTQGAQASQEAIDTIDGTVVMDADTSKVDEKIGKFMSSRGDRRRGEGAADVTVDVDADTSQADATTTAYVEGANAQTVQINAAVNTDGARAQLDELSVARSATLNISADPYSANADWAELVKDRQATLNIDADPRAAYRVITDLQKPIESTLRFRPDPAAAFRVKADLQRDTTSTHRIQADPSQPYRVLNDLHGTITKSLHIIEVEQRITRRVSP